ncbi:hypothetical protein V6N13_114867 [Hibiscus sabdariffa]|uniref:Leucine-rich repeat-containing N-terminal plant-type domain-containing protein n=1 Tax=Hibiscus sabdariffa TaxID=183260 RepID=A0ABR2U3S9_9ROSI
MEGLISVCLRLILALNLVSRVAGNAEGDALNAFRANVVDPNNMLQSWDPTLINPCTWRNITCNSDNSVTRVDLGNANLSGQLVPELGQLSNLQYLELYSNNISGTIPERLNNNSLTGQIPTSLTAIDTLQVLDLSNNKLVGDIPVNGSFANFQPISFANNRLNNPPPAPPLPPTPSTASTSSGNTAIAAIAGAVLLFSASAILFA